MAMLDSTTVFGDMNVNGNVNANKIFNAVYNDYAEWFERGSYTEPGDIITLNTNSKTENYIKGQKGMPVVGIHSDVYAMCIGGKKLANMDDNIKYYIPVSLSGRVPVKVKGSVNIGDVIILSDTNGVGIAADENTNAIDLIKCSVGIALESKTTNEVSLIKVKVK